MSRRRRPGQDTSRSTDRGSVRAAAGAWTNWGRTVTARPSSVVSPGDADAVAAALRSATVRGERVRPVGSGHSFTAVAAPVDVQLRLDRLSGVVALDEATGRVRVGAGTPLHELNPALEVLGLALPNLGDIDRQTLSGAISTGTHGTGAAWHGIASAVTGLALVLPDGALTWCDARTEPELFAAARVGLGALGVVTEVELAAVPAFRLRAQERAQPLAEVLEDVDGFATSADHVELYWFPHTDRALTKRNTRLSADRGGQPLSRWRGWLEDEVLANRLFEATNVLASALPRTTPGLNRVAARLLGAREFTDTSSRVFCSRRGVRFVESEYAVPRASLVPVLTELRAWLERTGAPVSFPVEVRFLAGDDVWLSTAYGRDTAYVAVHQYWRQDPTAYFDAFESIVAEHDGRPHWGKIHRLGLDELRAVHPRLEQFCAVRDRVDPDRVLANPYLTRVLGD